MKVQHGRRLAQGNKTASHIQRAGTASCQPIPAHSIPLQTEDFRGKKIRTTQRHGNLWRSQAQIPISLPPKAHGRSAAPMTADVRGISSINSLRPMRSPEIFAVRLQRSLYKAERSFISQPIKEFRGGIIAVRAMRMIRGFMLPMILSMPGRLTGRFGAIPLAQRRTRSCSNLRQPRINLFQPVALLLTPSFKLLIGVHVLI